MRQAIAKLVIFFAASAVILAENAFYAIFSLNPTLIDKKATLLAGGSFSFNFSERYTVSIGSYNMISRNLKANFIDTVTKTRPTFEYNYFSGAFEYIFASRNDWQYASQAKFSLGHIRYNLVSTEKNLVAGYNPNYGQDWFIAFEPNIAVKYRWRRWASFAGRIGYRFPLDASYQYLRSSYNNAKMRKPFIEISLEIGNF